MTYATITQKAIDDTESKHDIDVIDEMVKLMMSDPHYDGEGVTILIKDDKDITLTELFFEHV